MKNYGHYNADGSYSIVTPETPRNWYNYLYNDNYVTFTSQVGTGQGFLQDRLGTRLFAVETRGLYVHNGDSFWSLQALPVREERDRYECVHRPGATTVRIEKNGILSEDTIFVPQNEPELTGREFRLVRLTNTGNTPSRVRLISYCYNSLDGTYKYQGYNTASLDREKDYNGLRFPFTAFFEGEKRTFSFYHGCSLPIDGYDCAQNAFIGPYGTVQCPKALAEEGGCTDSPCTAEKICFAIQTTVELQPGESRECVFAMGIVPSPEAAVTPDAEQARRMLNDTLTYYREMSGNTVIHTPDEELNQLFNHWLKYQTLLGSRWARVRHNGYRDIASDTECLSAFAPELAWKRICRLLTYQYANGYAPRTFIDGQIRDNNFADCTVWLTFTVYAIIQELGRPELLLENVAFNDGSSASVYEHLRRSVDFLYHFTGLHGLVQIWGGDWNDCMNTAGLEHRGVSVWLSIAWYRANRQLAELAEMLGDEAEAAAARERGEIMRERIEKYGWDDEGGYYLYAYSDRDEKIGAYECEEGRVFLNPQLWAVLSGVSGNGREKTAIENAYRLLEDELGMRVSTPPYTQKSARIGAIAEKAPGVQENGGVYLHAMCWKLAVDGIMGRADRVKWDIDRILPFRNPVVNGRAEPYTLCNCYMGKETGYRYGTPGQSWRTATGQWFLKAFTLYVLGLMPVAEGLTVCPCMPPEFDQTTVIKRFRGTTYRVTYRHTGNSRLWADGIELQGRLLPLTGRETEIIAEY